MSRLTTVLRSEKWVVRRFRRCANIIECTYTNLDRCAFKKKCTINLFTRFKNIFRRHFWEKKMATVFIFRLQYNVTSATEHKPGWNIETDTLFFSGSVDIPTEHLCNRFVLLSVRAACNNWRTAELFNHHRSAMSVLWIVLVSDFQQHVFACSDIWVCVSGQKTSN